MSSYKQRVEWKNSPMFSALKFRKEETVKKEEVLNEFVLSLELGDFDHELTQEEINEIKTLVCKFLEYDKEKAEAGEAEMLDKWIKASS